MENIAPLAKILAEANGIDWRKIEGTGDGGLIVEQDILNFLTRVMSGEEEPPSTPVDLPPPDWEGDMAAMPSMDAAVAALSQAGVESDITDFVKSGAGTVPTPPTPAATAAPAGRDDVVQAPPVSLDDEGMDFELDEGDTEPVEAEPIAASAPDTTVVVSAPVDAEPMMPVDAPAAPLADAPAPAPYTFQDQPDTRMTSTAWDAPSTPAPTPAASAPVQDTAPAPAASAPEQPAPDAPQQGGGFGLGGFLSRLYRRNDAAAEATPSAPTPEPVQPAAPTPVAAQPEVAPAQPEPTPAAAEVQPEPVHVLPEVAPVVAEPQAPEEQYTHAEPAPIEPVHAPAAEAHVDAAPLGEPVVTDTAPQDTPESAPLVADQLRPDTDTAEEISEPNVSAPFATETPALAGVAAAPAAVPAASHGTARVARRGTLRRTLAAGAATEAAAHLSDALGSRVPLALLVARAATRHDGHTVALARVAGDDVTPIQADLHGDFRANAQAFAAGTAGVGADLLVIDGSSLENGEVLFLDGPALTVTHDANGVTLTLTGMSAGEAARVLDTVERELQTPIKLLF
ncbi:E3 binding domain-containing protein [Deinococcus maricopensis]|uniref:E3 binding domain protein n=1 Tax=Deinococcus maricopensis (strain DSM 21211 / LMG 22137 / NRRL B-23946 / LB-34) TaxID=709986 RepID=E8U4Y0_DEIML|nr:E3 binding domain-containing protein [Deinococcus maricopensis]ADV66119.1 E3 binding domain protein [Deinococcus maricopensis DSM 21211]